MRTHKSHTRTNKYHIMWVVGMKLTLSFCGSLSVYRILNKSLEVFLGLTSSPYVWGHVKSLSISPFTISSNSYHEHLLPGSLTSRTFLCLPAKLPRPKVSKSVCKDNDTSPRKLPYVGARHSLALTSPALWASVLWNSAPGFAWTDSDRFVFPFVIPPDGFKMNIAFK